MKKKVVSALLCATMVATMFAGCGSKESDNNASTPDTCLLYTSSEALKGSLRMVGNHLKSAKAEGSLTATPTGGAGTKVGLSDPVV